MDAEAWDSCLEAAALRGPEPGPAALPDGLEAILASAAEAYRSEREALLRLARREYSRHDLAKALLRSKKDLAPASIERALNALEGEGLLSDRRFAEFFVRSRLRSAKKGQRAIGASLFSKGLSRALVRESLVGQEEGFLVALKKSALSVYQGELRRAQNQPDALAMAKMRSFQKLLRRGFSSKDIKLVFKSLIDDTREIDE